MSYFCADLKKSDRCVSEFIDAYNNFLAPIGKAIIERILNEDQKDLKSKDATLRIKDSAGNEYEETHELKEDFLHRTTGNLAIEVECNGELSGITATKAEFFVYIVHYQGENCRKKCHIARTEDVRKLLNEGNYRKLNGGDGKRAVMYLVPSKDYEKISIMSFDMGVCSEPESRHKRFISWRK